jgi:hypothetical protein
VDPFPLKYPRKGRIRNKAYRIRNAGVCSGCELHYIDLTPQSTYIYRVRRCVWRLPKCWPPTPPSPLSECVLPPHQRRGVHNRRALWRGGGSIFWKTRDIGLASYSIISLRLTLSPRPPVYDPAEMTGQISRSHLAVYSAPPETPEIGRMYC